MESKSEIIIYQSPDGSTKVDVRMEDETVWLTQAQLGELFQKSKSTISEHIRNVFEEGELVEDSVVRNFRTTAAEWEAKHRILMRRRSHPSKSVTTTEQSSLFQGVLWKRI